jgi:hypothetical protein
MSQAAVEQILGRLMTDASFRDLFFAGRIEELQNRYALTGAEIQALTRSRATLHREQFEDEEAALDDAICRATVKLKNN